MDADALSMIVATAALGITVIDKVWTGSWSLSSKIAKMESGLRKAILDSKREIEETQREMETRQDEHIHQVGTTLTAFRDKFKDLELYIRDNYVKGPEFLRAMEKHAEITKVYQEQIVGRLDRLEKKLDGHPNGK